MTDTELLNYSSEHVLYEFAMLQQAMNALIEQRGKAGFLASVLIESYGIHLRNLICFLYDEGRQDDVVARHFFDDPIAWNPSISDTLRDARIRANKEISHLTEQRKSDLHPDKPWSTVKLWDEIYKVGKEFSAKASKAKLHDRVTRFFNQDSAELTVWIANNLQYTNSTATIVQTSASPVHSAPNIATHWKKTGG